MLRADGLVVLRNDRIVLDGVSFGVASGGAVVLRGPNGAGKSTLLRVLAGLRRPDGGAVTWDGEVVRDPVFHATRLGYLGHQDALKPGLTVRENLALTACVSGGDVVEAMAAFDLVDLADLPARLLSAGQKRRAALARVVLRRVPVWLLDEPSLGLDAHAIMRLGEALAVHRARGGMVIVTTHVPLPLPNCEILTLEPPVMGDVAGEGWL